MNRKYSIVVLVALCGLVLAAAGCGSDKKTAVTATSLPPVAATDTTTTASEDTDTTATTDTSSAGSSGASAKDCQDFATAASGIGTQLSAAMTGNTADLDKATKEFDELTAKAPDEIKPDFQTLDDMIGKIADGLKGVDLSGGTTPSADQLAKLQKLSSEIDQAAVTKAGANISAWAAKNCHA